MIELVIGQIYRAQDRSDSVRDRSDSARDRSDGARDRSVSSLVII